MANAAQEELARQREARKAEREAEQARKQDDKNRRGVTLNEPRDSKGMSGQKHGLHKNK